MALYGTGRTTGVCVDSGHEFSHATAVYEGYLIPHSIKKSKIAGSALTRHCLDRLLQIESWAQESLSVSDF